MHISHSDITKKYSDIIHDYLNNRYSVYAHSMGTCFSGEVCHIDLTNDGKHIVRAWLMRKHENLNSKWVGCDTITISLRKYNLNDGRTYWPEGGEELLNHKFYTIKENKFYTDSREEIIAIEKIRNDRDNYNYDSLVLMRSSIDANKLSTNLKDKILNKVHETHGAKRAKADCIKEICLYRDSIRMKATVKWEYNTKHGVIFYK